MDWDLWIRGFVDGDAEDLWIRGFVDGDAEDGFLCAVDWEGRGECWRRGGEPGWGTGLGGGERTACVAGAAVVALIAGSGRGPEPEGRGEGADIAMP